MINNLRYPPIKYNLKRIPEYLVYYSNKNKLYHDFVMSKTSKPYATCSMYCNVTRLYDKFNVFPSLLIYVIKSNPIQQGLGSKMLDVAKIFSNKKGCDGRFHLFATSLYLSEKVPHIFYRKYGMTTGDKKIDKKLDKFIKIGKSATDKDFSSMLMYYSPKKFKTEEVKLSFWQKIKKFFNISK